MKNVLLIGLGRFGRHMAQKLHDLNHQVLAIDKDERRVQDAMAYVTNAEIGDASDPALIDALGAMRALFAIQTHSATCSYCAAGSAFPSNTIHSPICSSACHGYSHFFKKSPATVCEKSNNSSVLT